MCGAADAGDVSRHKSHARKKEEDNLLLLLTPEKEEETKSSHYLRKMVSPACDDG